MRVLVVDDDDAFRRVVVMALQAEDIDVDDVNGAELAFERLRTHPAGTYDVMLLDVEMPGQDGWNVLEALRDAGRELPVVYLTARESVDDKVHGLNLGADDFIVKPVEVPELVARLHAVVRRRQQLASIEFGELRLDVARRRVSRSGRSVDLSPREYDVLLALVRAKGAVVSRKELLKEVWDMDFDPGTNILDVHIGRLRKKVDAKGRPLIQNERGQGYRLAAYAEGE